MVKSGVILLVENCVYVWQQVELKLRLWGRRVTEAETGTLSRGNG